MNKLFIALFAIFVLHGHSYLYAQSKPSTVIKPQYNYNFADDNEEETGLGGIPSNIVINNQSQPTAATTTPTDTEITVTTELGEIVLPLATSTKEKAPGPQRLAEVVERINQDYEVSVQECRNGSWLEKIWCKVSGWF